MEEGLNKRDKHLIIADDNTTKLDKKRDQIKKFIEVTRETTKNT